MEETKMEARLLYKLARQRKWGASHTSFDNLKKGFPSHLGKEVSGVAEELIRKNLILQKPTFYGLEVSLNPQRKDEIIRKIEVYFPMPF